jgi:hypothetical protein
MAASDIYLVKEPDVFYLLLALETFEKELSQMEKTHDWYASDTRPLLFECMVILKNLLEIETNEQETDDDDFEREAERLFTELCIERERDRDYQSEDEEYE